MADTLLMEIKTIGKGVRKAFKSVRTYAAPRPGIAVSRASEKDKTLTISSKFFKLLL